MKNYSLAVIFWLGLTVFVFAQAENLKMISSEVIRQDRRNGYQRVYRAMWNDKGIYIFLVPILSAPEARPAMGFTEEQYQNLLDVRTNIYSNHPDVVAVREELELLQKPDDPYLINASAQEQQRYHELMERFSYVGRNEVPKALEQIITPEQKRHLQEYMIAGMSEFPILSPEMFEALDLTDAQREQLQAIKQELEPELDAFALEMAEDHMYGEEMLYRAGEILENGGVLQDSEGFQEKRSQLMKTLEEADPEYRKREKATNDRGMDFSRRLKFRMFDVLTDEQMERMQRIVANPPEFLRKILEEARKEREESEKKDQWKPGPNSWKPGDPIPAEYLQQRQERRFPGRQ